MQTCRPGAESNRGSRPADRAPDVSLVCPTYRRPAPSGPTSGGPRCSKSLRATTALQRRQRGTDTYRHPNASQREQVDHDAPDRSGASDRRSCRRLGSARRAGANLFTRSRGQASQRRLIANRPLLQAALEKLGPSDRLVVHKVRHLARSMIDGLELLNDL